MKKNLGSQQTLESIFLKINETFSHQKMLFYPIYLKKEKKKISPKNAFLINLFSLRPTFFFLFLLSRKILFIVEKKKKKKPFKSFTKKKWQTCFSSNKLFFFFFHTR